MKVRIFNPFLLPALIVALGLTLAGRVTAQTFTPRYTFTRGDYNASFVITNSEGANPMAGLVLSGNTFYGTTQNGGTYADGTIFALNTNGTGVTILHTFTALVSSHNGDGANPYAGLILSGNTLYGTAQNGGLNGSGTVFAINTNGQGFTVLHTLAALTETNELGQLTNNDGANPYAGVILSGNTLYGTAPNGGINGSGTVFALNTNNLVYKALYGFTKTMQVTVDESGYFNLFQSNLDGASPRAGLILSGSTLYGTAPYGGTNGDGTVFSVGTNGLGFKTLHTFTLANEIFENSDGVGPVAGLLLASNTLYGTALLGGNGGEGTVFALNTNGSNFVTLHSFSALDPTYNTNNDGVTPYDGLILSGDTLYGTAANGGSSGEGTIFAINTTITNFTTLYDFDGYPDYPYGNISGAVPVGGLILSGDTLYGTASGGGSSDGGAMFTQNGTVFSLALGAVVSAPQLAILRSGMNIILSWPPSVTGWTLQTNNNLSTGAWGNYAGPINNNIATNSSPHGNLFFRLTQP